MRFKGTLLLLMLVCVLGAFVYFYEIKGGAQREKAKEAESLVWKMEDKDIRQIEIVSTDQHITAVREGDKEWQITVPKTLDADSDELNRMASSAASLRRESVVEDNAASLDRFGLQPPQLSLKLKTKDGKEHAVNFGTNNPTDSFTYAAFPNQRQVFLISSGAVDSFKKKTDDLRNHSVLSFEQSQAQSLAVRNPRGGFEITRDSDDRWWFKGADKRAADGPEVRGILNALAMGRVRDFFNDSPEDYVDLGLGKPMVEASVTYGKDKAIKRLIIGVEKSKLKKKAKSSAKEEKSLELAQSDVYMAKDASRQDLFFIEKDLVDKLLKSQNDVREKALVPIQRWDVDSISLVNTKGAFSFVKSGGEWYLGPEKKKAKWDAVNGILDAMEKPVKEWIDAPASMKEYGLDKPAIHIVLRQGNSILADCSFGKSAKTGIYAQVKGDSSVKIADPEGLDKLDRAEPDLLEPIPPANPKN